MDGIANHVAGSYRLGLPESDWIDLVLIPKRAQRPELKLAIKRAFGRQQTKDEPKLVGIYDGARFELHVVDLNHLGSMMIHSTGSQPFNGLIQARARKLGWRFNPYGLSELHSGEPVLQSSEEAAFFRVLRMPYIEAEDRLPGSVLSLPSLSAGDLMARVQLLELGWKVLD